MKPLSFLYFKNDLDNYRYVTEKTGIDVIPYCLWQWRFHNEGVERIEVLERDRENEGSVIWEYLVAKKGGMQ
jgi:hypothetical protein